MTVGLVWAQARAGVLGLDGTLPWHLPEDLRHFKALTTGQTVVMGRRTWESLPPAFRPLPGRVNVVLSSRAGLLAEGAEVVGTVDDVLRQHTDFWVIGGARVYAAFLPYADRIVVTDIDEDFAGDTTAPVIGDEWTQVSREPQTGWDTSAGGLRYAVRELARTPGSRTPAHRR